MTADKTRPAGLIRGHMVTAPGREDRLRAVIAAMLPQLDRLVIVFNRITEVPAEFTSDPRIQAITTNIDTRDAGMFFEPPAPDDIVFLLSDEIDYPPDYVARSIEQGNALGWDGNLFGYLGMIHRLADANRQRGWRQIRLFETPPKARGVQLLGIGTVVARGDAIPPIGFMLNFRDDPEVGLALSAQRAGRRAWVMARADNWLPRDIAPAPEPGSPRAARVTTPLPVVAGLREIIDTPRDHVDVPHHRYAKERGRFRLSLKAKGA